MNFPHALGHFASLQPEYIYQLKVMSSGHLGMALHDVNGDRHRRFDLRNASVMMSMKEIAELLEKESTS